MTDQETNSEATTTLTTEQVGEFLPEALRPYWSVLNEYPIIAAVIIIVIGFIAATILVSIMKRTVTQLTKRTKTDIDDQLLGILSRPAFLAVLYASLAVATVSLRLPDTFTSVVINILLSLTLLIWMNAAISVVSLLLSTLVRFKDRFEVVQASTVPLFDMVAKILLIAIAGYMLLRIWNVDATAWLASAGVAGIAIGFAARDTLANLFSGVFIVVDSPYKVGDFVNLDTGERGMVTHVGLRSTRMLTRDDIEITVPNAVMANQKIVNESAGSSPQRRVRVKAGVGYGSDADQVVDVLNAIANDHPEVVKTPSPRVRLRALGDSSLDFELLCWISEPVHRGKITHELLMEVYRRFNAEGIEIPFPKSDLYIRSMPSTTSATD
ncbi:MAG: mechanosensitive ion channel family protein [Pseudomonadota bacterium]